MLHMLTPLEVSILLALHNSHTLLEVTLIRTNNRKFYLVYVLKMFFLLISASYELQV